MPDFPGAVDIRGEGLLLGIGFAQPVLAVKADRP